MLRLKLANKMYALNSLYKKETNKVLIMRKQNNNPNKGVNFGELKKIASGGEVCAFMFTLQAMLSEYTKLPTIIFDEIDSGISGEIAYKMAEILKEMSLTMQMFTITHLPQLAAVGNQHIKIFKED